MFQASPCQELTQLGLQALAPKAQSMDLGFQPLTVIQTGGKQKETSFRFLHTQQAQVLPCYTVHPDSFLQGMPTAEKLRHDLHLVTFP